MFEKAGPFAWTDRKAEGHKPSIHYSLAFLERYAKHAGTNDLTGRLPEVAELKVKK